MKFKTLKDLLRKVKELETPLNEKYSDALIDKEIIFKELKEIINCQLNNSELIPNEYKNLLLWINETNCYVSCLWYNPEKDKINEDYGYSVVTFDELAFELEDEGIDFYELILEIINKNKLSLLNLLSTIKLFESDEMDEVTQISL